MSTEWQEISTAPKDGTPIWAYLADMGIRKLCYWSAEQIAEVEGGSPDDWEDSWCELSNYKEAWTPRFWLPTSVLPEPPK